MLIVAAAADRRKGHLSSLEQGLAKEGIHFEFHTIDPFSWAGILEWEHDFALAHSSDIICFVDAWDFLFQGSASSIVGALGSNLILFHPDAHCWPEPHKADRYPSAPTKYRYVNGTGPLGYGEEIAAAIKYGMDRFPIRGHESSVFADNDQRFWTDVYLSGIGKVDHNCRLSVPMNCVQADEFTISERRLKLNTGVTPSFVHLNGGSFYKNGALIKELTCE